MAEREHKTGDFEKIQNRLKINTFKLESLLEITKAINNNLSRDELFELYGTILKSQLNIGRLMLFSFDGQWNCVLRFGLKGRKIKISVEELLIPIADITYVTSNDLFKPFDIVIPVFHKDVPLAYVLIGDFDEERIEISPTIKHLPFIQTLTNIIAVAVENKKLARAQIRQESIRREMELAKEMQLMLFPETLPLTDKLDVAAYYQPHHEVGGDYYDFIRLNENEVAFCMADVSGKGMSAALLMSNFQANFRALIGRTSSLTELITELNQKVINSAKGERFITMFVAKYNIVNRTLNYINAAHNPPILMFGDVVNQLRIGSTGLGMFDELPTIYEGYTLVPENSLLFLYTDGVYDVENDKGENFGVGKLTEFLAQSKKLTSGELNNRLLKMLDEFRGNNNYTDDVTLLSCLIS